MTLTASAISSIIRPISQTVIISMEPKKEEEIKEDGEEQVDENYNPEEEVVDGNWKIIDLPQADVKTWEETSEILWEAKMKLYRWDKDQWKERAVGQFKFVKDKQTGKIRGVLKQDTTSKIMANFYGRQPLM